MTVFQVVFHLESDTVEDAVAAVNEWKVTPGATLAHITGMVIAVGMPVVVPDSGRVSEGETMEVMPEAIGNGGERVAESESD